MPSPVRFLFSGNDVQKIFVDTIQINEALRHRLPPGDGRRAGALLARGQIEEAIGLVLPYYDAVYAVCGQE